MNKLNLAYCAGVIDSDGCITIKSRKRIVKSGDCAKFRSYSASVFVRQVEPGAVDLLQSIFGGPIRIHAPSTAGGRDLRHWELTHCKATDIATALLPYLRIKRRQAEILIEFSRFISNHDARRHPFWFEWVKGEPTYTVREAAELKGVSLYTVWQMANNDTIPVSRSSNRRLSIPKRFWDTYETGRSGRSILPKGYTDAVEGFCAQIRRLNGPTRGVTTASRFQ